MKKERTPRQPKVWEALLALIVVIAVVVAAIRTKVGIQMGLAMGGCTAIVFALLMGNKWSDIQDTVKRVVGDSATTLLILLSVGMMVGIWIIGGTVPTLLYYGLKICSPISLCRWPLSSAQSPAFSPAPPSVLLPPWAWPCLA